MEGFTKLSEVDLVEDVNESTSVLVEEDGEVKRVPKSKIGAQADWNETDESKPSFILNKPTQFGGVTMYFKAYGGNYLYKKDNEGNLPTVFSEENAVTMDEFSSDFLTGGCIINNLDSTGKPVSSYGQVIYFAPYIGNTVAKVGVGNYSTILAGNYNFRAL